MHSHSCSHVPHDFAHVVEVSVGLSLVFGSALRGADYLDADADECVCMSENLPLADPHAPSAHIGTRLSQAANSDSAD